MSLPNSGGIENGGITIASVMKMLLIPEDREAQLYNHYINRSKNDTS